MIHSGRLHRHTAELTEPGDQPDQLTNNSPQVPEDHADVVTTAAEHGEKSIAIGSFQGASRQSAVVFHVPDHWLYGATAAQKFRDGPGDATLGTADEDLHIFHAMATVSAVNEGQFRLLIAQDFDLFQRLGQRVAVIGITPSRAFSMPCQAMGNARIPTTKPPRLVVATLTLVPNS